MWKEQIVKKFVGTERQEKAKIKSKKIEKNGNEKWDWNPYNKENAAQSCIWNEIIKSNKRKALVAQH